MESYINWNNYLYPGKSSPLIEELKKFKQNRLSNIPKIPTNRYGMSRIRYFGGFTPWTNIPIVEKYGGNI